MTAVASSPVRYGRGGQPKAEPAPFIPGMLERLKVRAFDHLSTGCSGCAVCVPLYLNIQAGEDLINGRGYRAGEDQWSAIEENPGVVVRVTEIDLLDGDPDSPYDCPLAMSLNRCTGRAWAVNFENAELVDVPRDEEVSFSLPASAREAVEKLVNGEQVGPFFFRLPVDLAALPLSNDDRAGAEKWDGITLVSSAGHSGRHSSGCHR